MDWVTGPAVDILIALNAIQPGHLIFMKECPCIGNPHGAVGDEKFIGGRRPLVVTTVVSEPALFPIIFRPLESRASDHCIHWSAGWCQVAGWKPDNQEETK